jgi:hypothetical protein
MTIFLVLQKIMSVESLSESDSGEEEEDEDLPPLEAKVFARSNRGENCVFGCTFFLSLFFLGRMIQKMIADQPNQDEFWDEKAQKFFAEEEDDQVITERCSSCFCFFGFFFCV